MLSGTLVTKLNCWHPGPLSVFSWHCGPFPNIVTPCYTVRRLHKPNPSPEKLGAADVEVSGVSMPSLRAFRAYTSCLSSTPPWRPAKLLLASLDFHRQSSNSSGSRWLDRQSRDTYSKQAKVMGLKSRAAFKLLQINESYRIFRPGMTVVDLVPTLLGVNGTAYLVC